MRNIAVAFFVVVSLIWLFFTTILLDEVDSNNDNRLNSVAVQVVEQQDTVMVDVRSLALLLGVEYKEEEDDKSSPSTITTFDVRIGVVVIYTSEVNFKVRVRIDIDGDKTQRDMIIGDKLYNYVLTEINPSSAVLDNGEDKIILKAFKNTVISVTDLPKELPSSL